MGQHDGECRPVGEDGQTTQDDSNHQHRGESVELRAVADNAHQLNMTDTHREGRARVSQGWKMSWGMIMMNGVEERIRSVGFKYSIVCVAVCINGEACYSIYRLQASVHLHIHTGLHAHTPQAYIQCDDFAIRVSVGTAAVEIGERNRSHHSGNTDDQCAE